MTSSAQKGAYYKNRTRRWLERCGYIVFDMEVVRWVGRPGGARFPIKKDQLGADLGAMSDTELIFVQVKGGRTGGTFPEARRKFAEFQFPPSTQQWVVGWEPRARKPVIVDCTGGQARTIDVSTMTYAPSAKKSKPSALDAAHNPDVPW